MSRIGKKIIEIPENISVIVENGVAKVSGPKGELSLNYHPKVKLISEDGKIRVEVKSNDLLAKSLHGLTRTLLSNMIEGVSKGFEKKLEIIGVGYRVQLQGDDLELNVGYSHTVNYHCPQGIKFNIQKNTISISGIDKQLVGETAAQIRKIRKPEPYKGKGIRYLGEIVKRKSGKAAKSTAGSA